MRTRWKAKSNICKTMQAMHSEVNAGSLIRNDSCPWGLTVLSYMCSLTDYWISLRQRVISRIVSSTWKVSKKRLQGQNINTDPNPHRMVLLNWIYMQIQQFWALIASSCHIWGKRVRFHLTHQSTKLSGMFLFSQEPQFG